MSVYAPGGNKIELYVGRGRSCCCYFPTESDYNYQIKLLAVDESRDNGRFVIIDRSMDVVVSIPWIIFRVDF